MEGVFRKRAAALKYECWDDALGAVNDYFFARLEVRIVALLHFVSLSSGNCPTLWIGWLSVPDLEFPDDHDVRSSPSLYSAG